MSDVKTVIIHGPLMMKVAEFAELHRLSESTVREIIAGTHPHYPPLKARYSKGKRKYVYITAEDAATWRASLPEA